MTVKIQEADVIEKAHETLEQHTNVYKTSALKTFIGHEKTVASERSELTDDELRARLEKKRLEREKLLEA